MSLASAAFWIDRDHDLLRLVLGDRKYGSENFVAPDDLVQAALQRGDVKRPRHAHCTRNVIEIAGGIELVDEPQPLLRKRERSPAAIFAPPQNRFAALRALSPHAFQ